MPADVVELIKSDHREVERLFDLLQKHPATRGLNFPVVSALLIAHSRAEESEVYPVAKDEAGETEEVAHSQGEHAEAEHMLEEMAAMDPESAEFDTALEELIKAVSHHVEEEESKVLPASNSDSATRGGPSSARRSSPRVPSTSVSGLARRRARSCGKQPETLGSLARVTARRRRSKPNSWSMRRKAANRSRGGNHE